MPPTQNHCNMKFVSKNIQFVCLLIIPVILCVFFFSNRSLDFWLPLLPFQHVKSPSLTYAPKISHTNSKIVSSVVHNLFKKDLIAVMELKKGVITIQDATIVSLIFFLHSLLKKILFLNKILFQITQFVRI